MRNIITIFLLFVITSQLCSAQMMKPNVMVVPSDKWCQDNGYMTKLGDTAIPDYRRAFNSNHDLLNVISKINSIMGDRGFPLENMETALKKMKTTNMERTLYTDKEGNPIKTNLLDELYRAAPADIILQLTWNVNSFGPKNTITFNLQALDSYTSKQIAGVEGTGMPSFSADIPTLLEEAVVGQMDTFCSRLIQYFTDVKNNGREVVLDFYLSNNTDIDFSTQYGDYELSEIITSLVAKGAVNHSFSRGAITGTMLQYKSVRIPISDETGMPIDAYAFSRNIARALKNSPYNITIKVLAKGLGEAALILGNE